jgi:hypothetical protein
MSLKNRILNPTGCCLLALVFATNPSFGNSVGNQATRQIQTEANSIREQLIEARDKEIEAHTSGAQDKIEAVNESAEIDIAKVPRFFYGAYGYPIPNQDYERTTAYIRVDAQKAINAINKDLAAMTKKINATYQEKLNAIDSSVANADSQIKPGTSEIQLSPVGSNLYVKNYVNYAVDQPKAALPKGLKAREKSMACKTTRPVANSQSNSQ